MKKLKHYLTNFGNESKAINKLCLFFMFSGFGYFLGHIILALYLNYFY